MKKRYSKKINLLRKTFLKDDFISIIQNKTFFDFLDYANEKFIKDFCKVYEKVWKEKPCIIEKIMRTKHIDNTNVWNIQNSFQGLIDNRPQLLLT